MVNSILAAAGLKGRRGRFTGAKPSAYVVWLDDADTEPGPDPVPGAPLTIRHDVTLELYEDKPDPIAEAALENAIVAAGLHFSKQDRYWLQTEQQYQVIYEITYYEKRRT
jgi:hypothetical protein